MLDESVKRRIVHQHHQMNAEGKLLTRPQLEQFYLTFRARFGPEQLSRLDGEDLLEAMHAHGNKDSLVYWLEFKNDEEFPTPRFGSISGGSAFKFGIFRRKETGTWVTADERNNPKDLTIEEAIGIARKHRDQLLRCVEALKQLPPNSSDDDYRQLQEVLDRDASDVDDLAWGHKYLSLVAPDKLDDLHTVEWQRYLLIKMLQMPPVGKGRYLCAGRFVAAAGELGLPMNNLTEVLGAIHGWRHRYWRIGTSDGSTPRNRWDLMKSGNCVAIGWEALEDLSWLDADKVSKDRLYAMLEAKYPSAPQHVGRMRSEIVNFVANMAKGDLVLASDGGTVIGVGRVNGSYFHESTSDFPHRRPVDWLSFDEWRMPNPEGVRTTVHEVRKDANNLLEVERRIQGCAPVVPVVVVVQRPGQSRIPQLIGIPGRVQSVLERKGQVILYGPPGTGKTYWAEKTACDLAAWSVFGKAFDQLDEEQRKKVVGTGQTSGSVRLCCFHPAYGYEDFIEGFRPETSNGQIVFNLRDGVFKRVCKDAEQSPNQPYFLIVDEINRGDIPRIFGELLTVLEKDKRSKNIILPVSQEGLRVPENVFLIGTMNTADRSISLLDAALRRRFGFIELMPDSSVLRDHVVAEIPLGAWFDALNRRICEHVGRDARNLQIGHSYLMMDGRPVKDLGSLKRAIRDDIVPLLEEYCYEDFSALQNILGSGLLDADRQRIRSELFEDGRDDELLQALKEPCPEIFTTAEALGATSTQDEALENGEDEDEDEDDAQ